jgi:hypothetical protein
MGRFRNLAKATVTALVLAGCAGAPAPVRDAAAASPAQPAALVTLTAANTCGIPGFRDAFTRLLRAARAAAHQCGDASMQPEFTEVAVACVERPDSHWGAHWTMVLGRRR